MDTKTAIFWVDFADKFQSDEKAALHLHNSCRRASVTVCRDTIAAARAQLHDPLFNRAVAREIARDIAAKEQEIN